MCVQFLKQFRLCFPGKNKSDHLRIDFLEKDYSFIISVLNHIFDMLHAKKNLPVLGEKKKKKTHLTIQVQNKLSLRKPFWFHFKS